MRSRRAAAAGSGCSATRGTRSAGPTPSTTNTGESWTARPTSVHRSLSWPSIAAVIAGRPVFIYNAGTDMTYLRAAFDAHGAPWPRLDYACAYNVAQTVRGPGKPGYLGGYRLHYVYERVVPDRSPAFEASWGQIGHDPVEDAEATARIVLAASERVGANSVAELLDEAYCPLLRMEPDSCETATTGTRTRRPRPPLPPAKIWERNCATRRAYLEIRRYWRGDPAVLDAHNYPKLGTPPVELQAYVRRRRRW
ncbi:hypothetical protein SAMN04489717_0963 [Actinopolymorpha singaporensis]|uniref:3'-5' exonuclease n=1 Tax=Actinopolymorpha singaporensis TaxID=117157 RepID=A0A1H1MTY8_9ACTN|nr:hypothetical protein SAMN04489717_0963 [Actinopolymorpha singaporensis]